jgi:hypothetical protein
MKRALFVALLASTAVATAAPAAIVVQVRPAGESRTVAFIADERGDPCALWFFFTQETSTLWVIGRPVEPCQESPAQTVTLPPLAAGRYTLIARLESGETWEKVSFLVSSGDPPDVAVDLDPLAPTPQDTVEVVLSTIERQFGDTLRFDSPPTIVEDRITFEGALSDCPVTCPPPQPVFFRGSRYLLPPLTPGLKTLELRIGDGTVLERTFTVADPPHALALRDGRFEVSLEWFDRQGVAHSPRAEILTRESGRFWFFNRDNVELTVKILDGTSLNDHFWLFAASMTDLGYTLTVVDHDRAACEPAGPCPRSRVYHGAPGENRNVIDTSLFRNSPDL